MNFSFKMTCGEVKPMIILRVTYHDGRDEIIETPVDMLFYDLRPHFKDTQGQDARDVEILRVM